jgi:phosphoribosylformimino-5-aminoimidazole carboxamide ribotide isomerase
MLIIPAIDLKDGQCVRLKQGRMEDDTVFSNDPVAMAARWVKEGARRLHLVDLNGAFAGEPVNETVIRDIAQSFPNIPIQIGGGIRDLQTIERYLKAGVTYAILGTKAVEEPKFVGEACNAFPDHIIVGLDARDGFVATDGWAKTSSIQAIELAQQFENDGVTSIVYTDIARDGMMKGVNISQTETLSKNISIPIIASGGIHTLSDVEALCQTDAKGITGVITGRAIYEGSLDLAQAQQYADRYKD